MRRLLKFLFWFIGGLVLLLVLIVAGVLLFVDPNDYKDEIAQLVKDKTGREVIFTGDISLHFFPWLGAEVQGVVLGNAPEFSPDPLAAPMATIGSAQASVRIAPLLTGSLEIGMVRLDKVALSLSRNAQGVTNWDDLVMALSGAGTQAAAEAQSTDLKKIGQLPVGQQTDTAPGQAAAGQATTFSLGGLEITDLSLVFDDQQAGARYDVSDLDLTVGAFTLGEPFDFDLSLLAEADAPQLGGSARLSGTAGLDLDAQRYEVAGLVLDADLSGMDLPGGAATVALRADRVQADLDAQTALLDGFTLAAYGAQVAGSLRADSILDGPLATGTVELAPCDLKAVLAALGEVIETTDPAALTSVSGQVGFQYRPDGLSANSLKLLVDETTLTATAEVNGFERPQVTFTAELDGVDLDRYLPPSSEQGSGAGDQASGDQASGDQATASQPAADQTTADQSPDQVAPGQPAPGPPPSNEVDFLRDLDLNGKAHIGSLKLSGGEFTDISLTVRLKDGVLDLEPVTLSLYGGQAQCAYSLDARTGTPLSTAGLKLSRVRMGDALRAFFGEAYVSGDLNLDTTAPVTFQSLDGDEMLRTLNGAFSLAAYNGVLPSGGTAAQLVDVASLVLFTSGTSTAGDNVTFDSILAKGTIEQGVIINPILLMKSPSVWAKGGGVIDLNRSLLDYQAVTKLVSNPDPDEDFDDVTAPEVAVYASGPLDDPTVDTGVIKGLGNLGLNIVTGVGEGAGDLVQGVTGLDLGIGSDDDKDGGEDEDTTIFEDVIEGVGDTLEDVGESLGIF